VLMADDFKLVPLGQPNVAQANDHICMNCTCQWRKGRGRGAMVPASVRRVLNMLPMVGLKFDSVMMRAQRQMHCTATKA
jgi:hypothetical protein